MFRVMVAMIALLVSSHVLAYGGVTGQVLEVRVDASGKGMVMFSQNVAGSPPGCVHSAYLNALAFDTNTPGGKAILAAALAAKATGNTMTAVGKGSCVIYGNAWVEDWDYGMLQ